MFIDYDPRIWIVSLDFVYSYFVLNSSYGRQLDSQSHRQWIVFFIVLRCSLTTEPIVLFVTLLKCFSFIFWEEFLLFSFFFSRQITVNFFFLCIFCFYFLVISLYCWCLKVLYYRLEILLWKTVNKKKLIKQQIRHETK